MTIPTLKESAIRQQATPESFRRGEEYYEEGAVTALTLRGDLLQASVEGSQYEPYQVCITFDAGGVTDATCTCPYDWGGWCKHIVATLLAALHQAEKIETRPALEGLLADLDREQLQALLLDLAARSPNLTGEIENQIALLRPAPTAPQTTTRIAASPTRRTEVDPQPIRRHIRAILHSAGYGSDSYAAAGGVVEEVSESLKQAQEFVAGGDGRNAITILEAITDEYVEGWTDLDDSDGYLGEFFGELGKIWTEAILTADLTSAERKQWAQKLAEWQSRASDYGIDDVFDAAQTAAEQGWDYPPLQRVLQGEITDKGAWKEKTPWFADDLAIARLTVLERQGRNQEYLYLAQAEGQLVQYVTMLVRLGRVQEAVDDGLAHLAAPDEFLKLAQALRERGELAQALRVGEHGLTREGNQAALASWVCDLAAGMGETERALQAAVIAFRAAPSLSAYQKVQELAGERWLPLRDELLAHLRQPTTYAPQAQVDIFLREGLVDDAITAVEKHASYGLLERVMDAAIQPRPDWVIEAARKQAERIMDAGDAQHYHYAVQWLERAQAAYRAANREAEWRTYLSEIRNRHQRKYKLIGMLEKFGK